ncbi:hypothetical protein DFH29DRAFT_1066437 [Suillus ampliporus]|nr:hypothetical protein DFH29DRAFT_1066437 [Suillus ampliporus]
MWVTMEEFSSTLEAVREYIIVPELHLQPVFQVIQQFKDLPDFLMFPVFLALRHQDHSTATLSQGRLPPHMEIVHAMKFFSSLAYEARERSRSTSNVLNYACQNWAVHLSRAPNPWDETLAHIFQSFWHHNLLSWLERQWCLKDLQSCLNILSDGQKLAQFRVGNMRSNRGEVIGQTGETKTRNQSGLRLLPSCWFECRGVDCE